MILAALLCLTLCGCMGGAEHRAVDTGVAVERSHWIFPLYHYQEKEGHKTFTPLFLVPIPVGRTDTAVAASDEAPFPTTDGTDSPSWSRGTSSTVADASLGSADRIPSGDGASIGSSRTGNTTNPQVEPGVWAASVPPAPVGILGDGTTLDGGATRSHLVRKGDTLYALATQYYGSGKEWQRIADANRDRLPAPEKLAIGMQLRIPR